MTAVNIGVVTREGRRDKGINRMFISNKLLSSSSCKLKLQYVSIHSAGLNLTHTSVFQDKVW